MSHQPPTWPPPPAPGDPSRPGPWAPPHPATRAGGAGGPWPATDPVPLLRPTPTWSPSPHRPGRRPAVLVAFVVLVAVLVAANVAVLTRTGGNTASMARRDPGTAPAGSVVSGGAPPLGTGVVLIDTVLGFEGGVGAGTGIVLTASGEVLTNHHVVEGATEIVVTVPEGGERFRATVAGSDASADVALLRLDGATDLAVAPLGDVTAVQVGDEVVALGNARGAGRLVPSAGRVTALEQDITASDGDGSNPERLEGLIRVSAALVSGQSGGPLYDDAGAVIGMNAAGSTSNRRFGGSGTGVGFAIPIDDALAVVAAVRAGRADDTVVIGTPPILGVIVRSDPEGTVDGVLVEGLATGGPAAGAGIRVGDVIVSLDGEPVRGGGELTAALQQRAAGDRVAVGVRRDGSLRTIEVELAAGPAR